MIARRRMLAAIGLLGLGSCVPPAHDLSFYNNSGRDLTIIIPETEGTLWKSGEYLTFTSVGSIVLRYEADSGLIFEVEGGAGEDYRYELKDDPLSGMARLRFVYTGRLTDNPQPHHITSQPKRACSHFRLDPDMGLYALGWDCTEKNLAEITIPKQPAGFPVFNMPPPAPPRPDPRSTFIGSTRDLTPQ